MEVWIVRKFKEYAREMCICLIVLLVMAGLYVECPNFQMVFETHNQTSPIFEIELSDSNMDVAEIYAEEVSHLRTATVVAAKLANTVKNGRMERLPVDLCIPMILSEKIPYYLEMNQRLAELPTNRSGLLLQYVHDKDGKKRITTT